jgi:hypothetical protein
LINAEDGGDDDVLEFAVADALIAAELEFV